MKASFYLILALVSGLISTAQAEYDIWVVELKITVNSEVKTRYSELLPGLWRENEDSISKTNLLDYYKFQQESGPATSITAYKELAKYNIDEIEITQLQQPETISLAVVKKITGRVVATRSFYDPVLITKPSKELTLIKPEEILLTDTTSTDGCYLQIMSTVSTDATKTEFKALVKDIRAIQLKHEANCDALISDRIAKIKNPHFIIICYPNIEE